MIISQLVTVEVNSAKINASFANPTLIVYVLTVCPMLGYYTLVDKRPQITFSVKVCEV